jgi:tetratricopeptide (TPR) repeat protein
MSQPQQTPKRFRVALSFPGEHRERVEKIAETLRETLGREKVLYDKWYGAEFAKPGLGVELPALYHGQSELLVFFFCKEFLKKEWCGLEWRAALDLIKREQYERLMLLRLDDIDIAEIPGLYSNDGFLDIRDKPDADVAAAILSRLGAEKLTSQTHRIFVGKLPAVNPTLIGREVQIAFLDRAWADPATNVVQVVAAGGTGKTALVDKWFRKHLGEATVFGWSFYSQGSSVDRQTSSDPFFADIIRWFDIKVAPEASIYIKAEAVARRLREERVLLLLDGVEPLQDSTGTLRDLPLKALIQELATGHKGLTVCTTRVEMDLPEAVALDLDNLTPEQGAEYLRQLLKLDTADEELKKASREYGNHALALTLLGTYLVDFCGGDILRRFEIRALTGEEGKLYQHTRRMIAAYERMFAGKPEADILRALGYFDRPAEPEGLKLVLPAVDDHTFRRALKRLHDARLILTTDPKQPLDCHPLVREHFAAQATQEGHARLYEHYKDRAPFQPDTLEEMTPLFYAVYHGCKAGQHQEALSDVYRDRILRGGYFYLLKQLGAFGTNLSLLANFFETPWARPVADLSPTDRALVINIAGSTLRAVGRLADAVEPTRAGAEARERLEQWENAAINYNNFSQLHLTLGNVVEAIAAARQSVDFAERSGDTFQTMTTLTALADALHQSGDVAEAERLFKEAERIQAESQPEYQIVYALQGYQYCDLLLTRGQTVKVLRRASQSLSWGTGQASLLAIGLDHLSLGRAYPPGSAEAAHHLDQAVDFLRSAGTLHHLPRALLARGTPHDLDEVLRIATRSGMRLYLADYHLAKGNLAEAERLINETGYHRRDAELKKLKQS